MEFIAFNMPFGDVKHRVRFWPVWPFDTSQRGCLLIVSNRHVRSPCLMQAGAFSHGVLIACICSIICLIFPCWGSRKSREYVYVFQGTQANESVCFSSWCETCCEDLTFRHHLWQCLSIPLDKVYLFEDTNQSLKIFRHWTWSKLASE